MTEHAVFNIDISAIQNIALTGVRRAAAFLGLGFRRADEPLPTSLVLDQNFGMRWFEEPLPEGLAKEVVQNYNIWLVGGALKELDQYHSLFLDEVWHVLRLTDHVGGPFPEGFGADKKFLNDTNVANKLKQIAEKLGADLPHISQFEAFSKARNALTHNQGIVRERDYNEADRLNLKWTTPQVILPDPDRGEIILEPGGLTQLPFGPLKAETAVTFRMEEREHNFVAGDQLVLDPFELSGIIFAYQMSIDAVIGPMRTAVELKIAANPPPAATTAPA